MDRHFLFEREREEAGGLLVGARDGLLGHPVAADVKEPDLAACLVDLGGNALHRRALVAEHRRDVDHRDRFERHALGTASEHRLVKGHAEFFRDNPPVASARILARRRRASKLRNAGDLDVRQALKP